MLANAGTLAGSVSTVVAHMAVPFTIILQAKKIDLLADRHLPICFVIYYEIVTVNPPDMTKQHTE
jgi:hypothetical protein